MKLESNATIQIQKPIEEVFDGIVNPDKMTNYFIAQSSGKLESNQKVFWKFSEFDEQFPITDVKIDGHNLISFVWDPETIVTILLETLHDGSTLVKVNEKGKDLNDDNLKWVVENSGGWANFLACLKAYLEYGINLRKGAFEFMRNT